MAREILRLHYFPFGGRAAAIRDTLRIGCIPFEDVHVPFERFAELKAAERLPFGSLPVFEVEIDGKQVSAAQSNAILRFAGRRAGLYPDGDPLRALKIDEVMDVAEDLYHAIGPSIDESDPSKRAAMRKVLAETTLPRWGRALERLLAANGRGSFAVGAALTIADLKLFYIVDKLTNGTLDGIPKTVFDGLEAIAEWRAKVETERDARLAAAAASSA